MKYNPKSLLFLFLSVVIIYVMIVALLIADKANQYSILYVAEILVSFLLVALIVLAINKVDIYQLISNRENIIINDSPFASALYNLDKKSFARISTHELFNPIKTLEDLILLLDNEDANELRVKIESYKLIDRFEKIGIITTNSSVAPKYYSYKFSLIIDQFRQKYLVIWIWEVSDSISEKMEIHDLMEKYRKRQYFLHEAFERAPVLLYLKQYNPEIEVIQNALATSITTRYNFDLQAQLESMVNLDQTSITKKFFIDDNIATYQFIRGKIDESVQYIFASDISDHAKLEANIKSLEGILEKVMDNISSGFLILNQDNKLVAYNTAFQNTFQLSSEVLEQKPQYSYVLELLREKNKFPEIKDYKVRHLELLRTVTNYATDLFHLSDGTTYKVTIIPSKDKNTILIFENITPNIKLEHELYDVKMLINAILNVIDDPIVLLSQDYIIKNASEAFSGLFLLDDSNDYIAEPNLKNFCKLILNKTTGIDSETLEKVIISCLEDKICNPIQINIEFTNYSVKPYHLFDQGIMLWFSKN